MSRYFAGVFCALVLLIGERCLAEEQAGAQAYSKRTSRGTVRLFGGGRRADVGDVIEKRCVVCHGCYDAPCQLKLSSNRGLRRGASKHVVYNSKRLWDAQPTRLGIDARKEHDWRKLGFYPVIGGASPADSSVSTLAQLLALARSNPPVADAPLDKGVSLDLHRALSCPKPSEIDAYLSANPRGGMPYGTAPLTDANYKLLEEWAQTGDPLPETSRKVPLAVANVIARFELFLNAPDKRRALVARYIYEHLFLAHLHIEGDDDAHYFRMIRSPTSPGEASGLATGQAQEQRRGQAPAEIPTRRPFDDPGPDPFYYRIVPVVDTVLHKEHIVYEIGLKRIARYHQIFFEADWRVSRLPDYSNQAGGNPFSTFAEIPATARYQFLLDDALFFVRSFIRGPVCYGQVAVDVIEDRFWVAFLDPAADLSLREPDYLRSITPALELPVAEADGDIVERLFSFSMTSSMDYLRRRNSAYSDEATGYAGLNYASIWDGDGGKNNGALLTIYRNFDSASVVTGFVGAIPKNAWIIDYPLFERLYYNLVAGFDVFGNVAHQLTTRMYMDDLRREGEAIFLSFLPRHRRRAYFNSWYRGEFSQLDEWLEATPIDVNVPTGIKYQSDRPKAEFLETLVRRRPGSWPTYDPINRCQLETCANSSAVKGELRRLVGDVAPWAKFFPDVALLVLKDPRRQNKIFSVVNDKAHLNVAFVFLEEERREPSSDRLTIVPGQFTSYPNFFFKARADQLAKFVDHVLRIRSQADYLDLVLKYGIRRSSPEFWPTYDLIQAQLRTQNPREAGLLDLNRYKDPKVDDPLD
ncbi:MAG: fatty acid cis/trans isomerase [Hyphomicrobiaceae bacterium]